MKMFSDVPPQAGVGSLEGVVAYYDVLHAATELTADDKTAMGMINGVVLDVDVFTRTGCNTGSTCATLHADTVITCIYHVVDDEYVLAA